MKQLETQPAATPAAGQPSPPPGAPGKDRPWLPWWAGIALALMLYALYQAWIAAPTEATMGIYQRIFYVHVPAALTGFGAFVVNLAASLWYLVRRNRAADALAVAAAEVGVTLLAVNLISGPIWAKPIWGIWWTWDARLTLTLVIWIMYVSYLVLRQFTPHSEMQPRLAAAYAMFIFVAVPVDYMAIRWWRTQHPQPVLFGGPHAGLAPAMLYALCAGFAAFAALAVTLARIRYRQERLRQKIQQRQRERALAA